MLAPASHFVGRMRLSGRNWRHPVLVEDFGQDNRYRYSVHRSNHKSRQSRRDAAAHPVQLVAHRTQDPGRPGNPAPCMVFAEEEGWADTLFPDPESLA